MNRVITSSRGDRNRCHNHDPFLEEDLVDDRKAHGHVHWRRGPQRSHGVEVVLRMGRLHSVRRGEADSRRWPLEVGDHDALVVVSEVGKGPARGGRNSPEADYAYGSHHDAGCIRVEDHDDRSNSRPVEGRRSHGVVVENVIGSGREALVVAGLVELQTVCQKCRSQ